MVTQDVSALLERLEAFEDRLSLRLESLSAYLDIYDDWSNLWVRGELHPKSGVHLVQPVELVVAAYDSASRVVGTTTRHFDTGSFFGFEVFEVLVIIPVTKLSRIRVYPERRD